VKKPLVIVPEYGDAFSRVLSSKRNFLLAPAANDTPPRSRDHWRALGPFTPGDVRTLVMPPPPAPRVDAWPDPPKSQVTLREDVSEFRLAPGPREPHLDGMGAWIDRYRKLHDDAAKGRAATVDTRTRKLF
jgi:hypothetical protein